MEQEDKPKQRVSARIRSKVSQRGKYWTNCNKAYHNLRKYLQDESGPKKKRKKKSKLKLKSKSKSKLKSKSKSKLKLKSKSKLKSKKKKQLYLNQKNGEICFIWGKQEDYPWWPGIIKNNQGKFFYFDELKPFVVCTYIVYISCFNFACVIYLDPKKQNMRNLTLTNQLYK